MPAHHPRAVGQRPGPRLALLHRDSATAHGRGPGPSARPPAPADQAEFDGCFSDLTADDETEETDWDDDVTDPADPNSDADDYQTDTGEDTADVFDDADSGNDPLDQTATQAWPRRSPGRTRGTGHGGRQAPVCRGLIYEVSGGVGGYAMAAASGAGASGPRRARCRRRPAGRSGPGPASSAGPTRSPCLRAWVARRRRCVDLLLGRRRRPHRALRRHRRRRPASAGPWSRATSRGPTRRARTTSGRGQR